MSIYSGMFILAGIAGVVPGPAAGPVFHAAAITAGIGIGALLVNGLWSLPFLVASHVVLIALTGFGRSGAWPFVLSGTLQDLLALFLLVRARFDPSMKTVRDALVLLIFGALIPCAVCSIVSYLACYALHQVNGEGFLTFILLWSMRGVAGIVATVPLILAFAPGQRPARLPLKNIEFMLVTAVTAILALITFLIPSPHGDAGYPRAFLPYPFLVWAALRLGLQGVSLCTFIVTVCAAQGTATAYGPFPIANNLTSVFMIWVYIVISTITALLLCVGREERRILEEMLIHAGEQERIRVGTELHDGICQQLAGVGFISGVLGDRRAILPDEVHPHVDHICSEIKRCIQSMRNLARGMSPFGIGTRHISLALANLAALTEGIYGIECPLTVTEPIAMLDQDATMHLFRIAQEAVSNAVRHGRATRVEIAAGMGAGCFSLRISDNGKGMQSTGHDENGLGFKTMAYRADLMNGSFSVKNRPDAAGVVVTCTVPAADRRGSAT